MKINKGDVILLCILFATLCLFLVNEFNILAGLEQISANFTNLFAVIFGGELLTFAIYKIGTAKYNGQKEVGLLKYDPQTNNKAVAQIEKDIEEIEASKGAHVNEQ